MFNKPLAGAQAWTLALQPVGHLSYGKILENKFYTELKLAAVLRG